jgi:hypothetical protein
MPITPLGRDILQAFLRGNGRVTFANRDSGDGGLRILAAAVVRHDSSGVASRQTVWDLDLAPGEAQAVYPCEASDQLLAGVEVLLWLFSPDQRGLRDVYLASPPDAAPAREWEVGVRPDTDPAENLEFAVPESSGLTAYIRPIQ